MFKKVLLAAFAACLFFVPAGCGGGLGGATSFVNTVGQNVDRNRYNNAVGVWNSARDRMQAALRTAESRVNAAKASPTQSTINAARSANQAFLDASNAALNAVRQVQAAAQRDQGVPDSQKNLAARNARTTQENINTARRWNTELNTLQQRIGGSSGGASTGITTLRSASRLVAANPNSGWAADKYPSLLETSIYAYDITSSGTVTSRRIRTDDTAVFREYTDGQGEGYLITVLGVRYGGDGTFYEHFSNGRVSSDFSLLRTTNGIPVYVATSRDGETRRVLLAPGTYSAAAVNGYYDPPSRRGDSEDIYSVNYGFRDAMRPRFNATYSGAMIGTDLFTRAALEGQARITYSSSERNVDVLLHGIRQHRDSAVTAGNYGGPSTFRFNGLDAAAGGYLGANNSATTGWAAHGWLFGPNAQESAGVFHSESDNHHVVGGWLAKR